MDWLDRSICQYSEYEPPIRYYYWSLLSAVSAIVKDKVWIDRGGSYNLYPNIYVLLFGPSGIRKGPPIALAKSIVTRVDNTRVINGRATVEAIIKELGTVQHKKDKRIINDSCGFIVSSELSSAIIGNTNSLDILTDLFDRIYNEGEWGYRLKNSEIIMLKNPTITWLAGTNEALFRDFVPEKNIKGGLIGRTFIIAETKPNKINSLMYSPEIAPNKEKIADDIRHLAQVAGPFQMADDVRQAFDEWYIKFTKDVGPKLEDETGTVGRVSDNILRVAMLISLARRTDMMLTIEDIEEAMKEVITLITPSKKVSNSAKQNEISTAEKRSRVVKHLIKMPEFSDTRIRLLRKFTFQMDYEDLDKIMSHLEQAKIITVERKGPEVEYKINMDNEKVRKYVEEL